MKVLRLWLALALGVFATAARADSPHQLWEGLRKAHPYHLQAVALSNAQADGTRVLVISEPPPHVTVDGLNKCGPRPFVSLEVKEHRVGHDGYVRDVVAVVPPLKESQVAELVDSLHDYLFGTTYKAEALELPLGKLPVVRDLSLSVSAEELRAWSTNPAQVFRPLEGGKSATLRDIFAARRSGVFLSQARGLVLWSLPRGVDLTGQRARARQFAVDSDLVLGAVATRDHLAVIGRERVTPIRVLPPLRYETLAMLASVGTGELAQSYERNRMLAGRFDKEWDWAPIYLSPPLINTEYGSLLNITDQLLKGWSQNGTVEYEAFDYPKPASWAFPQPLFRELKAATLTYNWNTAGAGYALERDGLEVLGLNRTGALPVSYFVGSDLDALAAAMANPRAMSAREYERLVKKVQPLIPKTGRFDPATLRDSPEARSLFTFRVALEILKHRDNRLVLTDFADLPKVRDRYAAALHGEPAGWIRTPAVVVSRATGLSVGTTGGHNLDAKVTEFRQAADLGAGKVEVVRECDQVVIKHSAADSNKIAQLVGRAGKDANNPGLKALLEADLPRIKSQAPRRPAAALYPSEKVSRRPDAARGYDRTQTPGVAGGWESAGPSGPAGPSIRIEKGDRKFQVVTADGEKLVARSWVSLAEMLAIQRVALPRGKHFRLGFVNFEADEVRNVLKSCEVRAEAVSGGRLNRRGLSAEDYKKMVADFDTAKAKIHDVEQTLLTKVPRKGQVEMRVKVEVPAKEAGRPSLFFRLRLYFRRVADGLAARVKTMVQKRLARFAEGSETLTDIVTELKTDLRDLGIDVELDVQRDRLLDTYYSRREKGRRHDTDRGDADRAV